MNDVSVTPVPQPGSPKPTPPPPPQPPPVEAPPAPPASATAVAPKDAVRFAQLAKKERGLREEREKLKAERATVDAAKVRLDAEEARRAKAKADPLGALQSLGVTYEQLVESVLNEKPQNPALLEVAAVKSDLEKLKEERAAEKKASSEAELARLRTEEASTIQRFHDSASEFIASKPDDYEQILLEGEQELVHAVLATEFEKTGKLLPFKDACDAVEAHLVERAVKAARAKKVQAKLQVEAVPVPKPVEKSKLLGITNRLAPTVATREVKKPADPFARALAYLERAGK